MLVLLKVDVSGQSSPIPIPASSTTETDALSIWIPFFLQFISAGQNTSSSNQAVLKVLIESLLGYIVV